MGTMMAPGRNSDAAAIKNQASPKATKGKPRTKANAILVSSRSITGSPPNPSGNSRGSHAPAAPQAASTSYKPISPSVASQTTVSNSIGALRTSGAMINANVKPNLQPAPAPVQQVQVQQRVTHALQPGRHIGGPSPAPHQLQHPRSSSIVHQQRHHPESPGQPPSQAQFGGHSQIPEGSIGIAHQQFVQGHAGGNEPQHSGQAIQYLQGPYGQPAGSYPVTEDGRALMATTMRPYPNIHNNPQPQSPASVSSPHSQDMHSRQFLSQQHPQMTSNMYSSYPHYQSMGHVQPPSYTHQPQSQAPPGLPSQPLIMPHQSPQLPQQYSRSPTGVNQSPRQKLEPSVMPMHRSIDTSGTMHRPPQAMSGPAQVPPGSAGSMQQSPRSGGGNNSSAAPGPIPASTPRVIREDADGTLWIEFEYSKDRVKMDYSIKCNVDSVTLSDLSEEFKTNNCVYPRAMKPKDEYTGNRYNYETECNNVGWALAKMNETLQGKRGLIQRAVDSWRNSSQDSKLRSRRVRRQQKMAKREKEKNPMSGGHGSVIPAAPLSAPRSGSMHGSIDLSGAQPYHHGPVGGAPNVAGGNEDVTGTGTIRPQAFHHSNLPSYTQGLVPATGAAMAPPGTGTTPHRLSRPGHAISHHQNSSISSTIGLGSMTMSDTFCGSGSGSGGGSSSVHTGDKRKRTFDEVDHNRELYGDVVGGVKRPKFIVLDDPLKNGRIRVKVQLEGVKVTEIPDSFRKKLSVYHRAYLPQQMKDRPGERGARAGGRWLEEGEESSPTPAGMGSEKDTDAEDDRAVMGRTIVKICNLNGGEGSEGGHADDNVAIDGRQRAYSRRPRELAVAIPRLSKAKWRKENLLNELGYRMSWNQNRAFADRLLFLQRSLDAYRNKVRTTILSSANLSEANSGSNAEGQDVGNTVPVVSPHFEMRVGKSKWEAGKKKAEREDEESGR